MQYSKLENNILIYYCVTGIILSTCASHNARQLFVVFQESCRNNCPQPTDGFERKLNKI